MSERSHIKNFCFLSQWVFSGRQGKSFPLLSLPVGISDKTILTDVNAEEWFLILNSKPPQFLLVDVGAVSD